MSGYDENFLKIKVPLPKPSKKLNKSYLKKPNLRKGFYRDYVNYTVATDKNRRAPVFAALNIDRTKMRVTSCIDEFMRELGISCSIQEKNVQKKY